MIGMGKKKPQYEKGHLEKKKEKTEKNKKIK